MTVPKLTLGGGIARAWLTWLFVSVEPVLVASLFQQVIGAARKIMSELNIVDHYMDTKTNFRKSHTLPFQLVPPSLIPSTCTYSAAFSVASTEQSLRKQVINRNIAIVSNYEGLCVDIYIQAHVTSLSALGVIIYSIIVLYIAKFVSPEIL